jgi:hypothetical protein
MAADDELVKQMKAAGATDQEIAAATESGPDPDDPLVTSLDYREALGQGLPGLRSTTNTLSAEFGKLYAMNDAGLKRLQNMLFDAGFYGSAPKGAIRFGTVDEYTEIAYQNALKLSASYLQAGVEKSVEDIAFDRKNHPAAEEPNAFHAVYMDPEQLKAAVRETASIVAGENLPDNVMDQIWQEYQSRKVANQRAQHEGQSYTDVGSLQDFATAKIGEIAPEKVAAQGLAEKAQEFYSMLGGD